MKHSPSTLYKATIPDLGLRLYNAVEKGLSGGSGFSSLFFRADDIGVPSRMFAEMVALFKKYQTPLCLAVVPTWLTKPRYHELVRATGDSQLFCWHQHGWMHKNHEAEGKKQEFGDSRALTQICYDIERGRDRLSILLGDDFFPVFTPPWNRCGETTIKVLKQYEFAGISRSSGAFPPVINSFTDFQVNVDLHTRKEENSVRSFEKLCSELQLSISSGRTGIMLHHQRMNRNALILLESLLQIVFQIKNLEAKHFKDLSM